MHSPIVSHQLKQVKQLLSKEKLSLMDIQVLKMITQELNVLRHDHPEVQDTLQAAEERIAQRIKQ